MGKIFTKVLNNRLTRWADINGKIDESQGAYRTGRSTADHIFSLHAMIQRYLSKRGSRCNRLRCPLARMSGLQCYNMGHNGHGINLYGASMTLMGN